MIATAFAEIVGLLCHYRQEKGAREALDHQKFIEWLEYHRHEEIKNLIVNTAALRTEIDNLLRSDHAAILLKLDEVLARLDEFRGLSLAMSAASIARTSVFTGTGLSDDAKTMLVVASGSTDGNVSKIDSSSYGEIISLHVQKSDQEFLGKPGDHREQARWLHAFDELVQAGYLEHTTHNGIFRITHRGYQLADALKQQKA